jgi:hypothetical protein
MISSTPRWCRGRKRGGEDGEENPRRVHQAGVKPDEFIADMERDVTIGQDFVAENLEVPRAYGNGHGARTESPKSRTFQRYEYATPRTGERTDSGCS